MDPQTYSHPILSQSWFTYRVAKAITSLPQLKDISSLNRGFGTGVKLRFRSARRLIIPKDYPSQWRVGKTIIPLFPGIQHLEGVSFRTANEYTGLKSLKLHINGRLQNYSHYYEIHYLNEHSLKRLEVGSANRSKECFNFRWNTDTSASANSETDETNVLPLFPSVTKLLLCNDHRQDLTNLLYNVDANRLLSLAIRPSPAVSAYQLGYFAVVGSMAVEDYALSALKTLDIPEQLINLTAVAPQLQALRVALTRVEGEDFLYPRSLRGCRRLRVLCLDLQRLPCDAPDWDLSGLELGSLHLDAFELRLPPALTDAGGRLSGLWAELSGCGHLRRFSIHCSSTLLPQLTLTGLEAVIALRIVTESTVEAAKLCLPRGLQRLIMHTTNKASAVHDTV